MGENEQKSVPTASENMLTPSTISERNTLTNGALTKLQKSSRTRSKSESHHPSSDKPKELVGVVVKSAKDRAHDRKPKNGKGLGKPKKEGGGGKGTWGRNGEVYEEEEPNPADPNYDSDNANNDEDIIMCEVNPDLTSQEFDRIVIPLLQEYFEHGMTLEVADTLMELNITHLKHRIVLTSVTLAMEKKGAQRELISVLLSDLFGLKVLCELDIELGFQALMNALPELKLDTPDAAEVLGKFMARCVADDCLNPCYIKEHTHAEDLARACLNQALVYLEERHGLTRLDTIWGLGGGQRPVKTLIKSMVMLIKEYISSRDMREAERCLVELEVPHFHHELVYEALVIAIESGLQLTKDAVVELLKHFSNSMMITEDQMVCGFKRVFGGMDDLVLDVPLAHRHLDDLLEKCCRAHIIPLSLRHQAPSRGRKRFVSEGDFGMSTRPIF